MLWSAWADALGFISELTTAENLRRRTQGRELDHPFAWSRNVGGRTGVRVDLPEGCYSDDTQLRLATSRAIANHGFDVEAFARVEMTVWPGYALGGGRASRAAAAAMAKQQANWANNFYDGWDSAGGNGAAMRIQPHVYAAGDLGSLAHLEDVIRNSVVTHGHPRAIVGAVFHAVALTYALENGAVPEPSAFNMLIDATRNAISVFYLQPELDSYWRPQWERKTGAPFELAWMETVDEVADLLRIAQRSWAELRAAGQDRRTAMGAYEELVHLLRLDNERTRGSGTLTTVAALLLASGFPDHPAQSAQIAASRLDTDTDTIGTMAAAIVGAASPRPLLSPVLDEEYLVREADRLWEISQDRVVEPFPYPDLLRWQPPKSAIETTGIALGRLALAGISYLDPVGEPIGNRQGVWAWARTDFGQSVLVKQRRELRELAEGNYPADRFERGSESLLSESRTSAPTMRRVGSVIAQPTLFQDQGDDGPGATVDEVLRWLTHSGYTDANLGRALRIVAERGRREDVARFVEEVAKAKFVAPGPRP